MTTTLIVDSLVRSFQVGSLYALMALGITLTMTVIKLPNFAHAEYVTVGAYVALVMSMAGISNPLLVMMGAGMGAVIVALLSHYIVFLPLERRSPSLYTMLLASFSVGLIIRYIIFLFVDRFDMFDKRIQIPLEIWIRNREIGLVLTNVFFWVVPTSILLVLALSLLLNFTPVGREMRALADNLDLARVLGIRVERVKVLTWVLVGAMAGIAGALWGLSTAINPLMGWVVILSVFAAAILGGLSSFTGTILGAYIVGLSENTLMQVLHSYVGLDFSFKPAIPFIIIVLVLVLRPQAFAEIFSGARGLDR